ncbi:DUF5667 domain-containing protein [Bacillus sp. REN3]|uniref:DUF5667 domain-containing protein n=1 Tax=Bacillus sp. REN3 TaxID=2802440 RepID=UPI001AEDCFAF|nr:DUF5667 domain-containing protein [Bacillus sp. REN3]
MKKLSSQEMKKIAKSTLALVLAGSFAFSPIALAEENKTDIETVDLKSNEYNSVSEDAIEDAKSQVEDLEETNPSLIPGDFFYFAKVALEKIKLAFTFDKAKEAELLAEYAKERLAEAGELFAEGKEEEALEVIKEAIEYMENSQDIVDEETFDDEDTDKDGTEQEEGTTPDDGAEDEEGSEDDVQTDDPEDKDSDTGEEPADEEEVTEEDGEKDPFEEIEKVLAQNIISLTAAMEKVKNPVAKAALQRNIEKSHAKTAERLAKLEAKFAKKQAEAEDTDKEELTETDPLVVEPDLQPADSAEEPVEEQTEKTMPADDDQSAVPAVVPGKAVKQQKKAEQAQVKRERNVAKQERKAAKQEAKQQKKEVKQQVKQEKAAKKLENKPNKAGNEGKGNGKN